MLLLDGLLLLDPTIVGRFFFGGCCCRKIYWSVFVIGIVVGIFVVGKGCGVFCCCWKSCWTDFVVAGKEVVGTVIGGSCCRKGY